tara:strand:+ start:189 stop:458 length:270 start_codon:yes stop_codon:yes gene_type:complete
MQVDLNLKSIALTITLLSALIGNVFVVGKVHSDFEVLKIRTSALEESQNVLSIKQEVLELGYKIKGIKLQIDPEYRTLCQKDMSNLVCQ